MLRQWWFERAGAFPPSVGKAIHEDINGQDRPESLANAFEIGVKVGKVAGAAARVVFFTFTTRAITIVFDFVVHILEIEVENVLGEGGFEEQAREVSDRISIGAIRKRDSRNAMQDVVGR